MQKKKRPPPKYKQYDPATGRGNPQEWARIAQAIAAQSNGSFGILNLTALPGTMEELRRIRRQAMLKVHPDHHGGSETEAAKINAAFEDLAKMIQAAEAKRAAPISQNSGVEVIQPATCTGILPQDLDSLDWIFDLKIDGERFLMYVGFDPYGDAETANTFLSRTKSKLDKRNVNRSKNVPHLSIGKYPDLKGTIIDGEIFLDSLQKTKSIMGSSPAEALQKQIESGKVNFHVFDILFLCGQDVRHEPLHKRRAMVKDVISKMNNPHIKLIESKTGPGIKAWFDSIVQKGGEGLVGKYLPARYGDQWAKMKKAVNLSCVIIGSKPGKGKFKDYIGSIEIGVYDQGEMTSLGYASGMDNKTREDMTANWKAYLGKAVDVFAMGTQESGKLRDPAFDKMREDIEPEDCTMEKLQRDLKTVLTRRAR